MEEVLLSDEFSLYPKKDSARVTITKSTLTIKAVKTNLEYVISIGDITGVQILKGNKTTISKWYLCIFSYPFNSQFKNGLKRQRCVRSLGISSSRSSEENKLCAQRWKKVIQHLITGRIVSSEEVNSLTELVPRHFIVYVNPFGGRGKAMQMYINQVKPMFAEAEIQHEVVKTEYPGHARKMAKNLKLQGYDGIIIVSGDGLIHEIINGLMEREDWETAIKTPLGIVPGGSGNALAASIVYASTCIIESKNLVVDALFEIIRGRTKDLSLSYAEDGDRSFYSFLNFGWGFVADVDIESEKYRGLGNARFTVGCLVRLVNLRRYHGTLSYLPAEHHHYKTTPNVLHGTDKKDNSNRASSQSLNDNASSPLLSSNQHRDLTGTSFRKASLKNDVTESERSSESDKQTTNDDVDIPSPSLEEVDIDSGSDADLNRKPFLLKTPLSDSLPSKWERLEGDFAFITPLSLSHIGEDMFMMPCAKMDESVMYIYCLKSTVTRLDLLQILLSINEGKHLDRSPRDTLVLPCRAFRLEPAPSPTGYMTADGELISYRPLQVSSTNVKAKVLCSVSSAIPT